MKVGEIFDLPEGVKMLVGSQGRITREKDVLGRYEVIEIEEEGQKILKGKVIVTYGNKRKKNS